MTFFFYELPTWISMPTFMLLFLALSWGILLAVRPWVQRMSRTHEDWDRVLG